MMCLCQFSAWATDAKSTEPLSPDAFKAQFSSLLEEEGVVGAQLVIFNDKEITLEHYHGLSQKSPDIGVNADTLFRAGSTTKTFVALAIMQLINQGHFNLHTKLSELAPEIEVTNPWADSHPIKVIHLLTHTAGFDDMHFKNIYNHTSESVTTLESINRDKEALEVRWQPGKHHAYANPGYGILGYLIEKQTKQPFDKYITEHIIAPLNIQHTQFGYKAGPEQTLSHGFSDGEFVENNEIYLAAAGNLSIPAKGIAQFGQYLLNSSQHALIKDINTDTIYKMERAHSTLAVKAGLTYGYGLGLYQTDRDGYLWVGHNGGIDQFITAFAYSRELNIGYVLMLNTDSMDYRKIANNLKGYLHQDAPAPQKAKAQILTQDVAGYYRTRYPRQGFIEGISWLVGGVKVSQQDEQLSVSSLISSEVKQLTHIGNGHFTNEGSSIATTVYITHPEHGNILHYDGAFLQKTSLLGAWLPLIYAVIFSVCVVFTLLYMFVWCFNIFKKKITTKQQIIYRVLPTLPVLSLIVIALLFSQLSFILVTIKSFSTVAIYLLTWVFAITSIASVWTSFKYSGSEPSRFARYYVPIASIFFALAAINFAYHGYIGLALWAW